MEKIVHGTPSGIDNTICSTGGALIFQKEIREKILLPKFPILITYSGESHDTGKIVEFIGNKHNQLREALEEIGGIVEEGIDALKKKEYSLL